MLVMTPEVHQAIREIVLQEMSDSPPMKTYMKSFRDDVLPWVGRLQEISAKCDILEDAVKTVLRSPNLTMDRPSVAPGELRPLQDAVHHMESRLRDFDMRCTGVERSLEEVRKNIDNPFRRLDSSANAAARREGSDRGSSVGSARSSARGGHAQQARSPPAEQTSRWQRAPDDVAPVTAQTSRAGGRTPPRNGPHSAPPSVGGPQKSPSSILSNWRHWV